MSEDVNPGKVGLVAEDLNVQQEESEGTHVSGMALPFEEVSRNGVQYSRESVQEAKDSMVGAAILYNHREDEVIGHVKSVEVREDGLYYEADLNPNHRFVENNYIERGDISNVSIQAIVEPRSGDTPVVDVQEFLELSMVTVPGFDDADVAQVEAVPEGVAKVESFVGDEHSHSVDTETEDVAGEPMGEYDDFEACVADNQDKDDPEAYCGAVKDRSEGFDDAADVIRMYMEQALNEIEAEFGEENVKIGEKDISRGVNSIMSEDVSSDESSESVTEAVELDSVLSVVERHMNQLMEDLESMEMDDDEEPEDGEEEPEEPEEEPEDEEEYDDKDKDEEEESVEEESVEEDEETEESVDDEEEVEEESVDEESEDGEEAEEVSEEAVSQRGSQMTESEAESFKGRIPSLG